MEKLLHRIETAALANKKQLAILLDPDHVNDLDQLDATIKLAEECGVSLFFIGGSLLVSNAFDACIRLVKERTSIPVVIFPGSPMQVSGEADGLLLLSLISGRNPEALIGYHVMAAPAIKASGVEVLPTGYLLIDSGAPTTASYMSNSTPIPHDKPEIAACTALAGEMLGLRLLYLDGGSGAQKHVSETMVSAVKKQVDCPLIVGGGIRDGATAAALWQAGADILVVGNATESNPEVIREIAQTLQLA